MYPIKISKNFHKIQKKTNIDIFFTTYLLQTFLFHSTQSHEVILRKMSQDEPSENPEMTILYLFYLLRRCENF